MKNYVLTSMANSTLHLPVVYSTREKAKERMQKEYLDRKEECKKEYETIMEAIIDKDYAYIVTDEGNYMEWNITECEVDVL